MGQLARGFPNPEEEIRHLLLHSSSLWNFVPSRISGLGLRSWWPPFVYFTNVFGASAVDQVPRGVWDTEMSSRVSTSVWGILAALSL